MPAQGNSSNFFQTLKKYFQWQDDLPLHGGATRNGGNGVKGIPTVDKWVAITVFWALAFVLLMGFGVYHCRSNSYLYNISCYKTDCSYKIEDNYLGSASFVQFQKSDLLDAELIRIDGKGDYVDSNKVRAEPKRYFGYSIRIKVRLPPEPNSRMKIERSIVFSPHDMSRRVTRTQVKKITDSLAKENVDFDVSKSSNFTTIGIISVAIGFLGLLLMCLFGQWSENNPRRLKKSS